MPIFTYRAHPVQIRSVAQALLAIFVENKFADKVIEQALRQNPKAGSRDRAFVAETTYDIVRNYRLYAAILDRTPNTELDFWEMIGVHLALTGADVNIGKGAQIDEFRKLNPEMLSERAATFRDERKFRESIPDWLDALGEQELGPLWDETLPWLNRPADVVLRTNRLKSDRLSLQKILAEEGIETKPAGEADALVLLRRQNVFQTQAFKKGLFEVQDYSSQLVAPFLDVHPGMRIVDACAGGGGKTLHLAALLEGKGAVIALDTLAWKLDALRQRARRAGASNIETRVIENSKVIKRLYGTADRVLLDVPCSGLGVLRRNPDSKWKLSLDFIQNLRVTQSEILQSYSRILKPGGRLVYATCSILPSENERQVEAFLASEAGSSFSFVADRKILPQDDGFDGFYMASLLKN
ncbi:MAG: RsmB/NOP family class I SAM-dependent RNA methyltransferase [Saprospiraceae bacterium]